MRKILTLLLIVILCSCSSSTGTKKDIFITEYLERLENSKKYTLLVAEKMPESNYNFKASEESLTFAQNLLHIGFAMDWHSQSLLGERKARTWQTDTVFKVAQKSKKEMLALIDKTFDEAITLISNFNPEKLKDRLDYFGLHRTKRQIMLLLSDHITHHRGQMLVYLRLNEIVPPRYVLFQ